MFLSDHLIFHHASGDALGNRPELSEGDIYVFLVSVGYELRLHSSLIAICVFLQRYKNAGFTLVE